MIKNWDRPEYHVWKMIKQRCYNKANQGYDNYGARGIKMCIPWRESFGNFLKDMGERPSDKHSIDRINNDGHYEPGNCRWTTQKEQVANQRSRLRLPDSDAGKVIVMFGGTTKLAALMEVSPSVVSHWVGDSWRGAHGVIPIKHYPQIELAAKKAGIPIKRIQPYLRSVCHACKRPLVDK